MPAVNRKVATKFEVTGEGEYSEAIKKINQNLKNMQSELKATESEFRDQQNTEEALRQKDADLNKIKDEQVKKYELLEKAMQEATEKVKNYEKEIGNTNTEIKSNREKIEGLSDEVKESGQAYKDCKDKMESYEDEMKLLKSSTSDTADEEQELREKMDACESEMQELSRETDGAAEGAAKLYEKDEQLNQKLDEQQAELDSATKKEQYYATEANNTKVKIDDLNQKIDQNKQYLEEAEQAEDDCAESIDEYGNQTKEAAEKQEEAAKGAQDLYEVLGAAFLLKALKEVYEAFKACVDIAAEFEYSMSNVQALSGATSEEMDRLAAAAKESGRTTVYTANDSADALGFMALAGWNTTEMIDGLDGVVNLAAASNIDLSTSSSLVADNLKAFGMEASDSETLVDKMSYAMSNSNTTTEQLGEAYKNCAATSTQLGYDVDDVTSALMVMANNGIKGGEAGTALASIMTRLGNDTRGCRDLLESYGVEVYDDTGRVNGLAEILDGTRGIWAGLSDEEKANTAYLVAGKTAQSEYMTLMGDSKATFNDYQDGLEGCAGAAQEMADIKLDNFTGATTLLKSAWDGLMTTMGENVLPILTPIIETITSLVNKINEFVEEHPQIIKAIEIFAVALGTTLVVAAIAAKVAMKATEEAVKDADKAIKGTTIGAIATAIAGAVTALMMLVQWFNNTSTAAGEMADQLEETNKKIDEEQAEYEKLKAENEETTQSWRDMAQELEELASKTDRTASENERMKELVDQLNSTVPDLNLAYDEQTGSLNMTNDELEKYFEYQQRQSDYQADVDHLNELYEEQATLQEQIGDAQDAVNQNQDRYNELMNGTIGNLMSHTGETAKNRRETKKANEEIEESTSKLKSVEDELAKTQDAVDEYNSKISSIGAEISVYGDRIDDLNQQFNASFSEIKESFGDQYELWDVVENKYTEVYDSAKESIEGQMSLLERADEKVDTSINDLLDCMDTQSSYWDEYSANLSIVYGRGIEGLDEYVASIDDGSAEAAGALAALASASDEDLQNIVSYYQNLDTKQSEVAGKQTQYSDEITGAQDGICDGIDTQIPHWQNVDDAINNLSSRGIDGLTGEDGLLASIDLMSSDGQDAYIELASLSDEELQIICDKQAQLNELLGDTAADAADMSTGYSNAMDQILIDMSLTLLQIEQKHQEAAEKTAQKIGATAIVEGRDSFIKGVQPAIADISDEFNEGDQIIYDQITGICQKWGYGSIAALIDGYDAQEPRAVAAMQEMAETINEDGWMVGNEENSPSRLYIAHGENTVQGLIEGYNNKQPAAIDKIKSVAGTLIDRFKGESPDDVLEGTGEKTVEGYGRGADNKKSAVNEVMKSAAEGALKKFKESSPADGLVESGKNTIRGYINGIDNKAGELYDKMKTVAGNALGWFRSTLGEQSPAKRFIESGENSMEGYIIGVENMQGKVGEALEMAAIEATEYFNGGLLATEMDVGGMSSTLGLTYAAQMDDAERAREARMQTYIQQAVIEVFGDRDINLDIDLTSEMDGKAVAKQTVQYTRSLLGSMSTVDSYIGGTKYSR